MSTFTNPYEDEYLDRSIEVDGLRLHYTEWNPTGDRPVVMLHGANVQLHTWDPIAHELANDFRVILPDLRGHGDSDWAPDGYRLASFVSDLEGIVDGLGLAPFELVGHSLGARIALAYAGENPDAARHVVLSDTGPEVTRKAALEARATVASTGEVRGFRTYQQALEHYEGMHPEWQPIFRELHALHQVKRNWADKLVFKADPELFWMMGSIALRENEYLWEICERITAPTLVLAGTRSSFFDDDIAGRLEAALPNGEIRWVDTGHYIPREDPDLFCRLTREFLAR